MRTYRAYSCGNGLEYQVSMCHWPNSMAAGHRAWAAIANDDVDKRHELKLLAPCPTARFTWLSLAPIISVTVSTACSCTSLKRSASFCVTPGGSGCFSVHFFLFKENQTQFTYYWIIHQMKLLWLKVKACQLKKVRHKVIKLRARSFFVFLFFVFWFRFLCMCFFVHILFEMLHVFEQNLMCMCRCTRVLWILVCTWD